MKKEQTVDFHIKWAWHSISRMYNSYAAQFGMTMSTSYVLLNIDTENGTPATKIAPVLGMESRSLVRSLKAMEEKGLIRRDIIEKDKRFVHIFLTERGKQKRDQARQGVIAFNTMIREKIPADQLAVFFTVIDQINQLVEDENTKLKAGSGSFEL